jgi:hypothetical protein
VRVLRNFALNTGALLMQKITQLLQLRDQPIDFLNRRASYPLHQGADVVRDEIAIGVGRTPERLSVTPNEFANFPLDSVFPWLLLVFGRLV